MPFPGDIFHGVVCVSVLINVLVQGKVYPFQAERLAQKIICPHEIGGIAVVRTVV